MAANGSGPRPLIPILSRLYRPFMPLAWPLVRFATGLFLVPHGAQKLFGWFGGGGLKGTSAAFAKMGFEPAGVMAPLVGGIEFFGGLLIALGFLTRPAAFAAAVVLAVAVTVHLPNGFFAGKGGYEFAMLWTILCAAFAVRGGGQFSIDRAIGREF
jgi:putative oxidoreductase